MKLIFTTLLSAIGVLAFAQPILTDAWLPQVGDEVSVLEVEIDTADPGFAGIDIVWDFSALPTGDMEDALTATFVDKNNTPNGDDYPEASIALNFEGVAYSYFGTLIDGSFVNYGSNLGGLVPTIYTDPEVITRIPFNYLDEVDRTYAGTSSIQTFVTHIEGERNVIADGYGDVILPGSSSPVENVLRLKTVDMYRDSTNYGGGNIREIFITETIGYTWTSDAFPFAVATMEIINTTQIGLADGIANDTNILATEYTFSYDPLLVTSKVPVVKADKIQLSAAPNPVGHTTIISGILDQPQEVLISVYDLQGKKLIQQTFGGQANENNWPLDLSTLNGGMYIIRLLGEQFESSLQIVKD